MADKLNITRAQVLSAIVEQDWDTLSSADARQCAERMLASITRKSNAPKQPSKAAMENERLAKQVLAVMPADEPVLTSWVMEHVNGIMTSQKCAAVMGVLLKAGHVEKVKVKNRYTGYKLV